MNTNAPSCAPLPRHPRETGTCVPHSGSRPRLGTLAAIVDDYIAQVRPRRHEERRWFGDQRLSLAGAIDRAATAQGKDGKMRHQWRLQNRVLSAFAKRLQRRIGSIRSASTFDRLHAVVGQAAGKGIGALTVYDTADRIGMFRNLAPVMVYLHAGTREGAKALGLHGRQTRSPRELPEAFRKLAPAEIEDCLCIYKSDLGRIAGRVRTSLPR